MRLMILRGKAHTLKLKRTKVFLLKWVVSTVHKRANRALMRFHFVPLLNEYRKRCYKKAWDITWGKRLREGWVAWNNEVSSSSLSSLSSSSLSSLSSLSSSSLSLSSSSLSL